MKLSWNVAGNAFALMVGLTFMVACQSGQDSYQPRTFSKDEVQAFCAKDVNIASCVKMKLIDAPKATPTGDLGTGSGNGSGASAQNQRQVITQPALAHGGAAGGSAATPAPVAPSKQAPVKPSDKAYVPKDLQPNLYKSVTGGPGAQSKVMLENIDRKSLLFSDNDNLACGKNEDAATLVRGLDIEVKGPADKLLLTLSAVVEVNGSKRLLFVDNEPVTNGKDGDISVIAAKLKDPVDNSEIDSSSIIKVLAVCVKEDCEEVHVRLDFMFDKGTVPAVFSLLKSTGYEIDRSNIGYKSQIKTFTQALSGDEAAVPLAGAAQLGQGAAALPEKMVADDKQPTPTAPVKDNTAPVTPAPQDKFEGGVQFNLAVQNLKALPPLASGPATSLLGGKTSTRSVMASGQAPKSNPFPASANALVANLNKQDASVTNMLHATTHVANNNSNLGVRTRAADLLKQQQIAAAKAKEDVKAAAKAPAATPAVKIEKASATTPAVKSTDAKPASTTSTLGSSLMSKETLAKGLAMFKQVFMSGSGSSSTAAAPVKASTDTAQPSKPQQQATLQLPQQPANMSPLVVVGTQSTPAATPPATKTN